MSAQFGNSVPVIRSMRPGDLVPVTELEERSYEFPWGHSIFTDCLVAGYENLVLDNGEQVVDQSG